MPGNAVIGALRVDLGLNTAQFATGIKRAQGLLGKFGLQLTLGLETVANEIGRVVGALPEAIKASIDHADALSKSAQKAGVTVEALSRLEYAAKFSEISLDGVTGSLAKLSKTMIEASTNAKSKSASAFAALGISVKDASGQLKSSDAVLSEIADRFAKLPDGVTKTALATQLFGKAGAQLIPLLNEGAAGLKRYADESDRLNNTVSTKTAAAANKFNDTLTQIQSTFAGLINKMAAASLGSLQQLADLLASPKFAAAASALADNVVGGLARIIQATTDAINTLTDLGDKLQWLSTLLPPGLNGITGLSKGSQAAALVTPASTNGPHQRYHRPRAPTPVDTDLGDIDLSKFTDATEALKPLDLGLDKTTEKVKTLGETIADELSDPLANLAVDLITGKNALADLASTALDFGKQLLASGIKTVLMSLLSGGSFGAPSAVGYGFGSYGSFDGGGYTGMGARSGGMDGKGGFLAMLHPDETVLDHTKGQGAGTVTNYISGSKADAAAIANEVTKQLKQQFPVMSAAYARNPHRKG